MFGIGGREGSSRILRNAQKVAAVLWVMAAVGTAPTWAMPNPNQRVAPSIAFEETVVVVTVTPGAQIAWTSFAREFEDRILYRVTRTDISIDEDSDGIITLDLEGPVPVQSVWFAADLRTSEFDVAIPEGSPAELVDFPVGAVRPGPVLDDFLSEQVGVEVLLVRARKGAWSLRVEDGREGDADGIRNGSVRALVELLEPVGDSPELHPALFKPTDVLVVIDRATLAIAASSVKDAHRGDS